LRKTINTSKRQSDPLCEYPKFTSQAVRFTISNGFIHSSHLFVYRVVRVGMPLSAHTVAATQMGGHFELINLVGPT